MKDLFYTDEIVPTEDELDQLAAKGPTGLDDAYVASCVETAWNVLKASPQDLERSLAAEVIFHASGMAKAFKTGDCASLRRHTLRFQKAVDDALVLEELGPENYRPAAALQRRRDSDDRRRSQSAQRQDQQGRLAEVCRDRNQPQARLPHSGQQIMCHKLYVLLRRAFVM
jgi:hypothetical protein